MQQASLLLVSMRARGGTQKVRWIRGINVGPEQLILFEAVITPIYVEIVWLVSGRVRLDYMVHMRLAHEQCAVATAVVCWLCVERINVYRFRRAGFKKRL